jgi:peroxiredoxin Q/BCP
MTHLKAGDTAPDFEGVIQDGTKLKLSDLSGKKVILYFYPKDMTPGCTAQACNLGENFSGLEQKGYTVVGVSADSVARHQKFTEKYSLPFPLIADEDLKIIQSYGVWGRKKFMGKEYDGIHRTTFVISEKGIIEKIIEKVATKTHTEQILKEMGIA